MDYKLSLTLGKKERRAAVHNLTSASVMLTLKDLFYMHYKTQDINLPYFSAEDVDKLRNEKVYDIIGAKIDGEPLEMIKLKLL